ncbi:MAG TPA: multiprotein-bridging factor 1 family protein [Candidatus Bilamarchaeaceae archaeon]|nr:multiprotein-bridging factor 1 family protein [Candidatus Bilamarchaeaceae archaeon]
MQCEMCGRHEATAIALIEGAKLATCPPCSRHGTVLFTLREEKGETMPRPFGPQKTEAEIVEGYGKTIRAAREKAGLTRLQLGQKIGEKENYLEAIEQGRVKPTLATAKKLEKFLEITLIETDAEGAGTLPSTGANVAPTLGDLLSQNKKRK